MKLETITLEDIRSWKPCYDPSKYAPESWRGTVLDILKANQIPWDERLWVACREELIDAKTLRLFACWCARQAMKLIPRNQRDPRSAAAINIAERFARGKATPKELEAAWEAARETAMEAAGEAAWAAARAAAWEAREAAREAAWAAARAAREAAREAAWAAARAAAWEAAWAAREAAWEAAREAQVKQLIKMLHG